MRTHMYVSVYKSNWKFTYLKVKATWNEKKSKSNWKNKTIVQMK